MARGLAVAAVVAAACAIGGLSVPASGAAALAALCAVWWTTQPIPILATSLLPFVVLPFLGALDRDAAAGSIGHPLILLLLGGFLLSTVMEHSGAHEALARSVIRLFGARTGARATVGFMVAAALSSMWISNTATALMLLPVATAVVSRSSAPERLAGPLFLGLAWACNIGGMGTPVGTPPNALLLAELGRLERAFSFLDFMTVGVPLVVLLVPLAAWQLSRGLDASVTIEPMNEVRWSMGSIRAMGLFAITVLLWVTRGAPFGGWSTALHLTGVGDHTVALGMVAVAAFVPDGVGGRLLDPRAALGIPWDLLLMFAGGLALGEGFRATGLDAVLASGFSGLAVLPAPVAVLAITLTVVFTTELVSNTATAALLLPVLATAAEQSGVAPEAWLVPATFAASCAFMMPIATAPNAVVFGTGKVPATTMVRQGLVLNGIAAVVIAGVCAFR